MKIRADEHVAPAALNAIRSIAPSDSREISHVRDVESAGTSDVHWITRFAKEGGQAILTADKDFIKNPPQIKAVSDTGIKIIHLPAKWQNADGRLQAAHLLLWWRRIEETLSTMKQRECYYPPWNLTETGRLNKIDIDFQRANKKIKKANRRSD